MNDLPKNIWAWMDADGGIPESGEWCGDKIAEYDTEYVRIDVAQAERDALIADNARLREALTWYASPEPYFLQGRARKPRTAIHADGGDKARAALGAS